MENRFFTCVAVLAFVAISAVIAPAKDKKAVASAKDKKPAASAKDKKPVKVFLLVGQSNMQGKGSAKHLAELVKSQPKKYGHLMKDGKWVKRDDVWGSFHARPGQRLGVGQFTRPGGRVGPEVGFGKVVGDAMNDDVVLLKIAWGGQSLAIDFRPPSAGKWTRKFNRDDGKSYKPATVGWAYKQIFNEMHMALDDLGKTFPELAGRKHEIVGFVWFQGWNDLINGGRRAEYKENMVLFIRDIRKHLGKKDLPFVIGVAGHGGDKPNAAGKQFREAQAAPAEMKEFKGNVAAVQTSPYWDPEPHGDGGYHYNGSASFFYDAGVAFGKAMLKMLKKK